LTLSSSINQVHFYDSIPGIKENNWECRNPSRILKSALDFSQKIGNAEERAKILNLCCF